MNRDSRSTLVTYGILSLSALCVVDARAGDGPALWRVEDGGNGHHYELVCPPGGITWTNARIAAEGREFEGMQGHLVTVNSPAEQDFLATTFPLWGAWIGLSDSRSEGSFEWVTGEPVTYTNWGTGEPNNAGDEDYVSYTAAENSWNDFRDSRTVHGTADFAYIVEYGSTPLPPECSTVVLPYLATDYRYRVVRQTVSGFELPEFDDSSFSTGDAAFGGNVGALPCELSNPREVRSDWPTGTDILIRKWFPLAASVDRLSVGVAIDNDVQVWVNGVDISGGLVPQENCPQRDSFIFSAPGSILVTGDNLIAVRGRDRDERAISYLDIQVTAHAPCEPEFLRGDSNADGIVNVADPVLALSSLFGPETLECLDAADADDDGVLNITDAVSLLGHLFLGTAAPAEPFPTCGTDPSVDELDCEMYRACS